MGSSKIWENQSEKLLGIHIDNNLKFGTHVNIMCREAGRKLTALARLSNIVNFKKLRTLMKSFFNSQFGYCPLVWMLHSRTLNTRINKLHERSLRILYKDAHSSFEDLLDKDKSVTIHIRNIQLLATEIYKFQHNLLPSFMKNIFENKEINYNLRNNSEFYRPEAKTVYYGTESLRFLAPKIWDIVPNEIKESPSVTTFKNNIKNWIPTNCPCRLCKTFYPGVGFI